MASDQTDPKSNFPSFPWASYQSQVLLDSLPPQQPTISQADDTSITSVEVYYFIHFFIVLFIVIQVMFIFYVDLGYVTVVLLSLILVLSWQPWMLLGFDHHLSCVSDLGVLGWVGFGGLGVILRKRLLFCVINSYLYSYYYNTLLLCIMIFTLYPIACIIYNIQFTPYNNNHPFSNNNFIHPFQNNHLNIFTLPIYNSICQQQYKFKTHRNPISKMKALLGMAKQRRKQQPTQPKPLTKLNLSKQKAPQPPSQQQASYTNQHFQQEQYQPDQQEILGYADYIGIKLPEEADLLYIAEEGLMAQLPADWDQREDQDGNVVYVNRRSGEMLGEHPCDEYYRQMVIKQRRKKGKGKTQVVSEFKGVPLGYFNIPAPKKDMDPLVKMQLQKKKKKQEQQKRKQFQDKKKQIKQKYNKKKQQLQAQLKTKQKKYKQKLQAQYQSQRSKVLKKMSEQEKSNEEKYRRQVERYEREVRAKMEKKYHDKRLVEKDRMQKMMKGKRQEIRQQLQLQVKNKKKQLQQQQKQKLKILAQKQKKSFPQYSQSDMLNQQLTKLKQQITQKQLKVHQQKLQTQRKTQQQNYHTSLHQIEKQYHDEMKKLENSQASVNRVEVKFDGLMAQVQANQRRQMEGLEYQVRMNRDLKKAERELQLQKFRNALKQQNKQDIQRLQRQLHNSITKLRAMKQQQHQSKITQAQNKIHQTYLQSLQHLHKKYQQQQQIILLQSKHPQHYENKDSQNETLSLLQQTLTNLNIRQQNLRVQINAIREEIGKLNKGYKAIRYKLDDEQLRMYQIVKKKIFEEGTEGGERGRENGEE